MAKKNKINVDVNVDDKGTTKKVGLGAKKAADNLEKTGKGAHSADRQLKGAAKASSNTTKNFSKMSQGISGGLVPAYATLAAQLFAVSAAFQFLKRAGDLVTLQRGQEAFAAVTGTGMRTLAKDIILATDSQIGFQEASQAAAIGVAAGLSPEQLTRLGSAAKQTAAILGRDVTDAFNRLVRGTTKAEPELLDELGIVLRLQKATSDYGKAIGKNAEDLSAFERTQAVTNDVLAQAEEKFGAIEAVVGLSVNPFNQLGKAFDDIIIKIQTLVAAIATPLSKVLTDFPLLVAGAFAFFLKGILTAAIPNLAAFGDKMRLVAKNGINDMRGLQAQMMATNRALAAARADPAAAASLGQMATKEMQGTLKASGLAGLHGFKGAATGTAQLTNKQVENLRRNLQKAFKDVEGFSAEAFNSINQNLDDIVLSNDGAAKKMTSSQQGFFTRQKVNFLKLKAQGISTFAALTKAAAGFGAAMITAFNVIGIIAMIFSLGMLAFNFLKTKLAGDNLNSSLDLQKQKMENLEEKVKSVNEEYKHFNAIQDILGRDRGTAALGAMGQRMGALSSADVRLGLENTAPEGDREEFERLKGRIDYVTNMQPKVTAELKKQKDILAQLNKEEKLGTKQAKKAQKDYQIAIQSQERLNEILAEASSARGGFNRFAAEQDQETVLGIMVDEQKGFTDAMLQSSPTLKKYNDLLNEHLDTNTALTPSLIERLSTLRSLAGAELNAIGNAKRLNKEANTQLDNIQRSFMPTTKYATALSSVQAAYDNMVDGLQALNPEEAELLVIYANQIEVLTQLDKLEKTRENRKAQLDLDNAQLGAQGFDRGSVGGLNMLSSGRKTTQNLQKQNQLEEKRNQQLEDRVILEDKLSTYRFEEQFKLKDRSKEIEEVQRLIDIKRKQIDVTEESIEILQKENDSMFQFMKQAGDAIEQQLGSAFASIIDGSKSASDAFDDFGKAIKTALAQIASQEIARQILSMIFSAIGGISTSTTTTPTEIDTAFVRYGGIVGPKPAQYRYGGVNKFSPGGIAEGPQAGYPAILHGREAVVPLPSGDKIPVEIKGGMGGDQNNISIVINTDGGGAQVTGDAQAGQQKELGKAIASVVQKELINQKRPGGILSPYGAS